MQQILVCRSLLTLNLINALNEDVLLFPCCCPLVDMCVAREFLFCGVLIAHMMFDVR
jgi:hypothetical protein